MVLQKHGADLHKVEENKGSVAVRINPVCADYNVLCNELYATESSLSF